MLANSLKIAKQFDKNPIRVAIGDSEEIYYVKDSELPAMNYQKNVFSLLTQKELYQLKKKYRASNKIFRRIQKCYKEGHDEINLKGHDCIENRLLISDIEEILLMRIKTEYKVKGADFLPYYNKDITSKIALHTAVVASSGAGKSTIVSMIVSLNFQDTSVYVFSPTASKDPAYLKLQNSIGKKRVRLIDSNKIDIPLDLDMLKPYGCVVIFDDLESTKQPARKYISDLQTTLLYEGRHRVNRKTGMGITVFSVIHDAFNSNITKASSIEASRIVLFPNLNRANSTKYLKNRLNFTMKNIKKLYEFVGKSRWVFLSLHHPQIVLTEDKIKIR